MTTRQEYDRKYRAAHRDRRNAQKREYRLRQGDLLRASERERDHARRALRPKQVKPPRASKPQPVREPKPVITLAPEVQKHLDYYLNAKAAKEEKTLIGYVAILRLFGQYIGDKWPPDFDNVNGFIAAAKKRGCNDTTLFNYWRVLRAWFTWLHKRGRITDNPILLSERPPGPKKLPRAPKAEDLKLLFATLRAEAEGWIGIRNLALITLALDSGMRVGELVKLTLDDLDLEKIRIIVTETKTDRDRYVVITPHARQVLTNWLQVRPDRDSDRLFLSSRGKGGLTESGIFRVLDGCLKRASARHFGVHSLRHGYAVYSLNNGAKLLDIQKQLGHTDIATTARYLLVTDDNERADRHALTSPVNGLLGGAL